MFVVFEGIDGSGKTTISNRVVRRLKARGFDTCHLRQDGKFASTVTEAVRSLARDARNLPLVPEAELLLYAARELQLCEEALRPALAASKLVVADRYFYTAEVLGRFGRGLPETWVRSLLELIRRGLEPDLVVLVDVDPALARARRKASKLDEPSRKPPSRKGLAGAGLAERLRQGYLELARAEPQRFVIVDNEAALDETVARVERLIELGATRGMAAALADLGPRDPAPRPEPPHAPREGLERFLSWCTARGEREPGVAAYLLSGFHGERVDGLREGLAARAPRAVLYALSGLTDAVSFALRDRLAPDYPGEVAASLAGIGNHEPRALALRQALSERAGAEVAASLRGLSDPHAVALRAQLYERQPGAVVASLGGLDDEGAWELRERYLQTARAHLADDLDIASLVSRSIRGSGDERAWALRDACWPVAPPAVLKSLTDLDDERSWQWRERWLERAPRPVLQSLGLLRTERTWQLRSAAVLLAKEALDGLAGVDDERAWALRERAADRWPSTVVKSLGGLQDSERGRALLSRQLAGHGERLGVLRQVSLLALNLSPELTERED